MTLEKAMSYGRKIRRPQNCMGPGSWIEGFYWWQENGQWFYGMPNKWKSILDIPGLWEIHKNATDWIVEGIGEKERPSWW